MSDETPVRGRVASLNVSGGGVPKRPVGTARVGPEGLEGDRQDDTRHHGGPRRAVCLLALEVLERLAAEGHPIGIGTTGENVTVSGLPWGDVLPGRRLAFEGGVVLEVTGFALPCGKIRGSFADGHVDRLHHEDHPGQSRVYARVVSEGTLVAGEGVSLLPRPSGAA